MKYLNTSDDLNREMTRLLDDYEQYYWMVAWAGKSFPHSIQLERNSHKIQKLVVGLHFYQTAPSFIETFNPLPSVRFIKTTSGVFHSKVYLFLQDEANWEALIGSPNFTPSAFGKNNEACILIQGSEAPDGFLENIKTSILSAWEQGTTFTDPELADYRRLAQRYPRPDDAGQPPMDDNGPAVREAPITRMTWREYMDRLFAARSGQVSERLLLLDIVAEHFHHYPVFADMPALFRKQVGGYIYANQPVNFQLFGGMFNAAAFKQAINQQPESISQALDAIPATGPVTHAHYQAFVNLFDEALNGGNKYRSGTRLLAMKRPDIFFALSTGNNTQAAIDFGIQDIDGMNFNRYWQEIVLPVQRSNWWRHPAPITEAERSIANRRAAFLDVLYYHPEQANG